MRVALVISLRPCFDPWQVWPLRNPGNDGRLVDKLKDWIGHNGQQYFSSYSPVMKKQYEQQLGYAWNLKSTEKVFSTNAY